MNEKESTVLQENYPEIEIDSLSFDWNVPPFRVHQGGARRSEICGEIRGVEWTLKISTPKRNLTPDSDLHLELSLKCDSSVQVYVMCHFLIGGQHYNDNKFSGLYGSGEIINFIFPICALFEVIEGNVRSSDSSFITLNLSQELSHAKFYKPITPLKQSLDTLLNSGEFSDAFIETDDGMTLPVHQAVITFRSPVFKAMFGNDMVEARTKVIKISDFSSETVKNLIRYIYTECIPPFRCNPAAELLRAADKYQIPDLVVICSENLSLNLIEENATKLLLLADIHGAISLKTGALQFIANNRWKFGSASNFELVQHSRNLLLEIICAMANTKIYSDQSDASD